MAEKREFCSSQDVEGHQGGDNPTSPVDAERPGIYRPNILDYKLKMLLYGPAGVGKTSLLATANLYELTTPILIVNVEGGVLSVADASVLGLSEPPDIVDLNNFADLEQIFWYLAKGDHPYKSVGIDSLSELQMLNLEYIVGRLVGKMSSGGARRESLDDVWREDYGASTQQLRRVTRMFRDLPLHVFFTCHEAVSQDRDRNETVAPMLTPRLRAAVVGYMDVVGYMYVDTDETSQTEPVRRLLCRPYGKWLAKDRTPGQRLGLVMDNPTIPRMMDAITGRGFDG